MSHELTSDSRNLYAIKAPWHIGDTGADGRSVVLPEAFSLAVALRDSSIGTALTTARELYFGDGTAAGREAHVSSTGKVLAVVPSGAPLVQYSDLFSAVEPLFELHGILCHAAGTLADGGVAWIAGRMPGDFEISHFDGRRDVHYPWITVQAAHDKRFALSVFVAQMRAECANMLAAIQADERTTGHRVRARGSEESYRSRWASAIDGFGDMLAAERLQRASVQKLADTPMDMASFGDFAASLLLQAETRAKAETDAMQALFGTRDERNEAVKVLLAASTDPDPEHARRVVLDLGVGKEAPISRRSANLFASRYDRLENLFVGGIGNAGRDRYDALNAVTEWVDHEGVRSHRGDSEHVAQTRYVSSVAGEGATLKATAFEMLAS